MKRLQYKVGIAVLASLAGIAPVTAQTDAAVEAF